MSLRQRLAPGAPVAIGHFLFEFATPGIGFLAEGAGVDFLVLDLEHTGFTFETAKSVVVSARAAGVPVVVRVPSHDSSDLARACDVGADGVMAPLVSSAQEARKIVSALKYPPTGSRGVSQFQMHDRYRVGAFAEKARAANDAMTVLLQIESAAGVEAAPDIAAIDGVDGLWIGHMDLSCSLGAPAQFDRPAFRSAVRRVVDAARSCGKRAGRLGRNAEECAALVEQGFDCVAVGTDSSLYQSALAAQVQTLRARVGG